MNRVLVWLHRDLRLADHPALAWAGAAEREPLPVYLHAPDEEQPWAPGGASRWWLDASLRALATDLAAHGLELRCAAGPSLDALLRLARELGADAVAWNRRLHPALAARDAGVAAGLRDAGLAVHQFDAGLLSPPADPCKDDGSAYRVYTPFARRLRQGLELAPPLPLGTPPARPALPAGPALQAIDALGLPDAHRWHAKLAAHWEPGERGAWSRAERFIEAAIARYHEGRDHPAEPLTSRLSAHLHCGEITAAQLYARLQPCLQGGLGAAATRGAARFLDELLWREFAHHVLWHFPHSAQRSLDARYERGVWGDDATLLARWQRGETGMPLVDAGMHELWASGWMHNRVRMVAASYLTKQMGLHWRHGAAWFWDTLVDADLANNSLGWQWVAGCGVDAAPYYRIFNPELQAQKFDPDGRYRARWLPASYRRRPPPPLLDPGAARAAALQRYQQYVKQES